MIRKISNIQNSDIRQAAESYCKNINGSIDLDAGPMDFRWGETEEGYTIWYAIFNNQENAEENFHSFHQKDKNKSSKLLRYIWISVL